MSKRDSKLRRVLSGPYRDKFAAVWRGGPLGADKPLCETFLGRIDDLIKTGRTDAAIYADLRGLYEENRDRFQATLISGREKRAQVRAGQVKSLLPPGFKPASFLDIGCGDGLVTNSLADIFNLSAGKTWGIDLAAPAQSGKFRFMGYDAEGHIPAPAASFDFMTVLMVLHHVRRPEEMLREAARVLSPGGLLLVRDHDTRSREAFEFFAVMDEIFYTVFDPAPGLARDFNYRSHQEWEKAFGEAGLTVVKTDFSDTHSAFAPVWFLLRKTGPEPKPPSNSA